MWILRHAFAIAALPITVAIIVPLWISRRYGIAFRTPETLTAWMCVAVAVGFFLIGALLFVSTVFLFASRGKGTLAPWDPPSHLVIGGPYRYVRNPMISGVFFLVFGEALLLRSGPHAIYAAIVVLINLIYIPLLEEPQLRRRFGGEYDQYKREVPRFLPLTKRAASRRP